MAIEKVGSDYILVCDVCGEKAPRYFDYFDEAAEYKNESDWKVVKDCGGWWDYCPGCRSFQTIYTTLIGKRNAVTDELSKLNTFNPGPKEAESVFILTGERRAYDQAARIVSELLDNISAQKEAKNEEYVDRLTKASVQLITLQTRCMAYSVGTLCQSCDMAPECVALTKMLGLLRQKGPEELQKMFNEELKASGKS